MKPSFASFAAACALCLGSSSFAHVVLQDSAQDANDWAEVPAGGTSTKGLKSPAVLLEVLDVQAAGAHAH